MKSWFNLELVLKYPSCITGDLLLPRTGEHDNETAKFKAKKKLPGLILKGRTWKELCTQCLVEILQPF